MSGLTPASYHDGCKSANNWQSIYSKAIAYLILTLFVVFPFFLKGQVEHLVPQVISKIAHDLPAFTQGLAIDADQLYESVGLYGQSGLRIFELSTGKLVRKFSLSTKFFAEGIAVFPHFIIQLTWKEHKAFVYDRVSLKLQDILFYSGEGWGLCKDQESVWMSNGSSVLTQRDVKTFSPLKTLNVSYMNEPLEYLNELECVGNHLYANVWQENWIARIDKQTGGLTGVIDLSSLLSDSEKKRLRPDEVLNGIAYRFETGTFYITGKGWPWIFEVRFVPRDSKAIKIKN